jgi:hypothetical protein
MQQQRRGFDFNKEDEAPKVHDRVAQLHRSLLDQLTHVETQRRIIDSALYGNEVPLSKVMTALTLGIFQGDPTTGPDSLRQNLQSEYTDRLIRIINGGTYLPAAQAVAFAEIERVKGLVSNAPAFKANPAHSSLLLYRIRRGLDEK